MAVVVIEWIFKNLHDDVKMTYKLIIFDWDGTLINSFESIAACNHAIAAHYGVPVPSEEMVREAIGQSFDKALRVCFPSVEESVLPQLARAYHEKMQHPDFHSRLFDGTQEMLDACRKTNAKMAVATAKVRSEFDEESRSVGLGSYFDLVLCDGEQGYKPELRKMRYLLDYFAVAPHEAIMVGDTITDMQFAKNANVASVAVAFGAHGESVLLQQNPDFLIHNWDDFIAKIIA